MSDVKSMTIFVNRFPDVVIQILDVGINGDTMLSALRQQMGAQLEDADDHLTLLPGESLSIVPDTAPSAMTTIRWIEGEEFQ